MQIRGYRVELGKVESALRTVPGVRHAVAALIGTGAPVLAAAVAGDPDEIGDVAAAVAELLPSYMTSTRIVFLGQMPLTANAKLGRSAVVALLEADAANLSGPAGGVDGTPRNEVEAALGAIVAEVLNENSVGVHDDFFALGGDSVLATTVVARGRDWLDVDHAVVVDLLATRTVAGFAERLDTREAKRGTPERLTVIARHYLEIAALTDAEVLAEG